MDMKTLINKANPMIRITVPEIEKIYDRYYYIKDLRLGLLKDNYCTEKIMSLCDGIKVKPSLDIVDITDCIIDVAKHFYELGLRRKEE